MLERITGAVGTIVLAAGALVAVGGSTVAAAPNDPCNEIRVIGAAGSGERDDYAENRNFAGLGKYGYETLTNLTSDVAKANSGRIVTSEQIFYTAHRIPGSHNEIDPFISSIENGKVKALAQVQGYLARCGEKARVVLFGYSQGAMVMHSVLNKIGGDKRIIGSVLVADGARLGDDTTINLGTAKRGPGSGSGIGQASKKFVLPKLPTSVGAKTISVCNEKDPVCDTYPDARIITRILENLTSETHSRYAPALWRAPLFDLVSPHLRMPMKSIVGTWATSWADPYEGVITGKLQVHAESPFRASFSLRRVDGSTCSVQMVETARTSAVRFQAGFDTKTLSGDCGKTSARPDWFNYVNENTLRLDGPMRMEFRRV